MKIYCIPFFACLLFFAHAGIAQKSSTDSGLIAHEWGTFTSIAGDDGKAMEWVPLNVKDLSFDTSAGLHSTPRPKDLPSFVENLNWAVFKQGLSATIRMETPVLYFYSRENTAITVNVKFAKGLITEWYPHAISSDPNSGLEQAALYREHAGEGSISWHAVVVPTGASAQFPRDSADSNNRYYAARETLSNPLVVRAPSGVQQEKFLFYRGVSLSSLPLAARFVDNGKLQLENSFSESVPAVIWFERRGERIGYRISDPAQGVTVLEAPQMTASLDHLYSDLEEVLVAQGLYREEAHAMVRTWRDSWFAEGSRLFYIVPRSFVDRILPLTVSPSPAQTVRVFVGRLELMSPATKRAVAKAMAANDKATLAKYGRFLEPILRSVNSDSARSSADLGSKPFVVK